MAANEQFHRQVTLLVQVLPFIAEESCFALKGGTAINLFIRDMPRLSVDIDLAYLPIADRDTSLKAIDTALCRIAENIRTELHGVRVHEALLPNEGIVYKLIINRDGVQVKVEVTPVLRGCVYEPEMRTVSPQVEATYGFAETQVVSFHDLYAGKMVAALDRQHPRDLFDIHNLLNREGVDEAMREAFIVYLISHNRPIAEVLAPNLRDITPDFGREFIGMTEKPVTIEELLKAREQLIRTMVDDMPQNHRELLLSFEQGEPDWSLIAVSSVENLPAVQWRMNNNKQLAEARRRMLAESLYEVLGLNVK
ncbi:MAG: nucleotidyl transferase AbiEii/AbiGii toxin family protein [Gammaproteobacteria bacterium]|nr:nucleotidyl transferase AbiEii/AbiGii toxin family protein [Gammaproteobacteria bacterium]